MAAYAFSRLRWRGRDRVFALFLAGLMVPTIFTLPPNLVLVEQLGLVDTLLGIALPGLFMTPFAVFFLRQFFLNLPREVEEAALMAAKLAAALPMLVLFACCARRIVNSIGFNGIK